MNEPSEPPEPPDRYVGSAPVRPPASAPVTAIPYTEPMPTPPRQRGSLLMAAGITVVAFIVLVVGVIVGLSLRFDSNDAQPPPAAPAAPPTPTAPTAKPDSPKRATEEFLAAAVKGDQGGMYERLCGMLKGDGTGKPTGGGLNWLNGLVSYKVGQEKITGPTGSVDVELTIPFLGPIKFDVFLLQEDGGWRVCGATPA